jgi:signal transduction histidine kinase
MKICTYTQSSFCNRRALWYNKKMGTKASRFSILAECRAVQIGVWQCPPFLFLVMGFITIAAMIATYTLASRYVDQPEIAALIVAIVTVILLVVGNSIITGFNKLAEANRMKTEFVSIITHQLRSPLSVFKWTLGVIKRDLQEGKDTSQVATFIQALEENTESMNQLVSSLLEISRLEMQRFVLKNAPYSLEQATKKAFDTYQKYAAAANLKLSLTAEPSLPDIHGDQERIAIVIQNFIDNAIKYSKAGTIEITIKKETPLRIRWEIHDHGVGIPAKEQRYIFTKFYRAQNARTQHTHGTGIGLYVSKAIIEASGGKIGFTSKEGDGSTFWFSLPITSQETTQGAQH